jgi:hypothetical protein
VTIALVSKVMCSPTSIDSINFAHERLTLCWVTDLNIGIEFFG